MGMGFPLSTPARDAGLVVASLIAASLVISASWSQSGGPRARAKNEWPGAARSGLTAGFHTAELTVRWKATRRSSCMTAVYRIPPVRGFPEALPAWLIRRNPEHLTPTIGVTFTLNRDAERL
jgi:hypothetical protein